MFRIRCFPRKFHFENYTSRIRSVPNFAGSDHDAFENDASENEVSEFKATIERNKEKDSMLIYKTV